MPTDTPFQGDNCDGTVVKTRKLFTLESSSAQVLCCNALPLYFCHQLDARGFKNHLHHSVNLEDIK